MKVYKFKQSLYFFIILGAIAIFSSPCFAITREEFDSTLKRICKEKYQTHVVCKPVGDTVWIYLPYTYGRFGLAGTKQKDNDLYIEYKIASFNPYKTIEPPELKFLVQKILGEIRKLLLGTVQPYKFFVLVVNDIQAEFLLQQPYEQWHIGYFDDVKNYSVGADFSGEGYSRLVWHEEPLKAIKDKNGKDALLSYRDIKGEHIDYREITLREFVEKQIKWRIYKRFTIEYNRTPFDLSAKEREDAVINIIHIVLKAYNFKEFERFHLKDSTFLFEKEAFLEFLREPIEKYGSGEITRKPAF